MKNLIIVFIFSISWLSLSSQSFSIHVDYMPHFSRLTQQYFLESHKLSHLVSLKASYNINDKIDLTCGILFLNTGENNNYTNDLVDPVNPYPTVIRTKQNHNYVGIPLGIIKRVGKVSVHPEIAISYNMANNKKYRIKYSDDSIREYQEFTESFDGIINKITVPISVSTYYDIGIKKFSITFGIKAYYSLTTSIDINQYKRNYYGFGIYTGIKI